ncbi:MAG: hypothetical protein HS111_12400 [Kofleriaceae bacterium]|nr:hypothetical protein [Kofleriaceae bacterium]
MVVALDAFAAPPVAGRWPRAPPRSSSFARWWCSSPRDPGGAPGVGAPAADALDSILAARAMLVVRVGAVSLLVDAELPGSPTGRARRCAPRRRAAAAHRRMSTVER